jgi:hypothetical protein
MGLAKTSEYQALQKYLTDRYANMVVLTFAEIEDILGFELPSLARLKQEWWVDPTSLQSDSWIAAQRTAVPNMVARTVTFTRALA